MTLVQLVLPEEMTKYVKINTMLNFDVNVGAQCKQVFDSVRYLAHRPSKTPWTSFPEITFISNAQMLSM